ncbi:hypothetical protein QFX18_11490 [Saccharophagus degradans]|uniref:hypothetical protein n=1 Tax=Saccharophagus degradans TaxID=86304 RepID=UPI0024782A8C|nr:hypothetical protein [Saccharophagus degradans]WGO96669.1 hypothetical protein QFX18_11490 [Saccharophagus degradans]
MYQLDDKNIFVKVLDIEVPWAHTWADMRAGKTDLERRERYREYSDKHLSKFSENIEWWAFSIFVKKSGRLLDVDNVPKPIIDSFCQRQIVRDKSEYKNLGLFPDDDLKWVRAVNVHGEPAQVNSTRIQIYGYLPKP